MPTIEEMLFEPVQSACGRARRMHTEFATRHGLPTRTFETPTGAPSMGAKGLVAGAVAAVGHADVTLATLQDSMLPIEVGDPELRARGRHPALRALQLADPAGHVPYLYPHGRSSAARGDGTHRRQMGRPSQPHVR